MRNVLLVGVGVALLALVTVAVSAPPRGMAILKLPTTREGITVELTTTTRQKIAVTSKGVVVRPGSFDVKSVVVTKADDKKVVWRLVGEDDMAMLSRVMVDPDQERVIDMGPPLKLYVRAWRPGPATPVHITVDSRGMSREVYYPAAWTSNKRPPGIPFQVLDEDGTSVLASGRMTFKDGSSSHTWTPPAGYSRRFTVVLRPELGPFEFTLAIDYTGAAARTK